MLILPTDIGTIANLTNNLYLELKKNNAIVFVVLLNHSILSNLNFDNKFTFNSKKSYGIFSVFKFIEKILFLRKIKKRIQPDITVGTMYNCSYVNVLSGGSDFKIGLFHSPYYQTRDKGFILYSLYLLSYYLIFSKLDKLYCVSEGIRNAIAIRFKNIKTPQIKTVYNLHNLHLIEELSKESITDSEIDIFKKNIIISVGRLELNKSPERLICAYSKLDEEVKIKTNLIFIGENVNDYQSQLHDLCMKLQIEDKVFFLGTVINPYKYIKRSKFLVSSSYTEGLPGVLIESLILGIPIISTNSSFGIWEILSEEKKYNKYLDSTYITTAGIITSNISYFDKSKIDLDIFNLKESIEVMLLNYNMKVDFPFIQKIQPEFIVNQFINPN